MTFLSSSIDSLQSAYDTGETITIASGTPIALTTAGATEEGITVTDGSDTVAMLGNSVRLPNGSLAAPAIAFSDGGSWNAGISWDGTDMVFGTGGASRLEIRDDYINALQEIRGADGNATTPAFTYLSQNDTGVYLDNTTIPTLGLSVEGAAALLLRRLLDEAAGDEIAFSFTPTVNKAAGIYTGMRIDVTETAVVAATEHKVFDLATGGTTFAYVRPPTALHANDEGALALPDGHNSYPSLAFANDIDTGLRLITTGELGFIAGGTRRASVKGGAFELNNNVDLIFDTAGGSDLGSATAGFGRAFAEDGLVTAPAVTFRQEGDTGLYRPAADQLGLAANSEAVIVDNDGATPSFRPDVTATWALGEASLRWDVLYMDGGTEALPSISVGETDVGLYQPAADQLGLAANSESIIVDNDGATPSLRPDADNTWDLGEASFRYADVYAATTSIGDLHMHDPDQGAQSPYLILIEGHDTLHVLDVQSEKRYTVPMVEAPLQEGDLEKMASARAKWAGVHEEAA